MKDQQTAKRDAIAIEFDERVAPGFIGFDASAMDAIKNAYIANKLDNYCSWYASHVIAFCELMPEYGPEYLTSVYFDLVEDGDDPEQAFLATVCSALERDL